MLSSVLPKSQENQPLSIQPGYSIVWMQTQTTIAIVHPDNASSAHSPTALNERACQIAAPQPPPSKTTILPGLDHIDQNLSRIQDPGVYLTSAGRMNPAYLAQKYPGFYVPEENFSPNTPTLDNAKPSSREKEHPWSGHCKTLTTVESWKQNQTGTGEHAYKAYIGQFKVSLTQSQN